ncbi:reverse transcriptase domain-containing protein [Tanacetum coccineum]
MEKAFNERHQGVLPRNTIPNPREDIKVITTRTGITLTGHSVPPPHPSSSSKEVERDPKPTMDQIEECMALDDLGANINLMPLSVWKKLMIPELVPTRMTLELANRTVAYPAGIPEDVFMQVGYTMGGMMSSTTSHLGSIPVLFEFSPKYTLYPFSEVPGKTWTKDGAEGNL